MGEENWQNEISCPWKMIPTKEKFQLICPKVFHRLINGCVITYTLSHIRTSQAAKGSKIQPLCKAFFPLLAPHFVL
jgi:hypothetical protein